VSSKATDTQVRQLERAGFEEWDTDRYGWTVAPFVDDETVGLGTMIIVEYLDDRWCYSVTVDGAQDNADWGVGKPLNPSYVAFEEGRFDNPLACADEAVGYLRQSLEAVLDRLPTIPAPESEDAITRHARVYARVYGVPVHEVVAARCKEDK